MFGSPNSKFIDADALVIMRVSDVEHFMHDLFMHGGHASQSTTPSPSLFAGMFFAFFIYFFASFIFQYKMGKNDAVFLMPPPAYEIPGELPKKDEVQPESPPPTYEIAVGPTAQSVVKEV